jgi:UDP-N-acetylmuramate--alanine ligase
VIGGRLRAFGSGARLGRGEYMVAEADESDRSFLMLWPSIAVMTNIDHEHMESYRSFAELQQAFADFANKVPFYGSVVACADDANLAAVLPRVTRKVVTYGFDPQADVRGSDVQLGAFGGRCTVERRRRDTAAPLGVLELAVPGRHNLQNALAAVTVALQIGVRFDQAASALAAFEGAERRFERHGEAGGRRLRASPHRDRGHARRRPRVAQPAADRGVSTASIHPDAEPDGRLWPGAERRG